MFTKRLNRIKGQYERPFRRNDIVGTAFTPRPSFDSIDISNANEKQAEAKAFFAQLQKTCKNNE